MVNYILSKSPNGLFLIFERSVQFDFTIRLENNVIKLEKIEKIRDELFEYELAGNGKTWQREGADILLAKLGINKESNY